MLVYEHEERRTIDAPADEVFALLADVQGHAALAGSDEVKEIRLLSEGPMRVGTEWEADEDARMGKKGHQAFVARSRMSAFEPPYRMAWTSTPPMKPTPRRIEWSYDLAPTPSGGTEVVERVEVDFNPAMNVLMRLPYKRMRGHYVEEGMRKTLDNLAARAKH